ncbi:MAG TPA: bifunctional phosphoribosylaminoimidazolecarboxamide formyltransferase/inosine monophosphate cyclohydrolase [Opitutae bacterium]|nr:bifunctional phosphoribosylaminoimidazolecarboxamide formyltransferase/inosine monophosphate cyclohydrolase [Opitutae bacterium]
MPDQLKITRALISVSNKSGVVDFARKLTAHNIEIISTGGTARTLREAGLDVRDVSSLTDFPEMLDGRVKTLHPCIHGGLLGVRDNPDHLLAMQENSIKPIDLICIDLYPFEKTASDPKSTSELIIEQIDIGGPAMIRSAAKNHKFVTVITNPEQYDLVLSDLEENSGSTSIDIRFSLAKDAFIRTARYDQAIAKWFEESNSGFSEMIYTQSKLQQTLRYGENPDQPAAIYRQLDYQGPSVVNASVVAGKPLSYNNLMDSAAALELVQDLTSASGKPTAAIIKHANPCGAAIADSLEDAFTKAWECDTLAAFGGIVCVSGEVTSTIAKTIAEGNKFLEVVVAPSFLDSATSTLLNKWKNIRLLAVGNRPRIDRWKQLRSVEGGVLVQELKPVSAKTQEWTHVAGPSPTCTQIEDAKLAWITCAHLKSNSISLVSDGALIGGGMGQVDRVSAAKLAIQRAGDRLCNADNVVAGSDAFFPFPDAPKILIDAGINCIVQPGGSVRDHETIDLCDKQNITLLHTGERRFRH